ncbi:MAG: hypothetical protein FJY83_05690 [Candidatus Aminicenantes bacterium]|nr:hypothetical protein [Candidatus Aminicenantes bacterium]
MILPAVDPALDAEKKHVRCCPKCGALYDYFRSHEYMVNGAEDEETLTRLAAEKAEAFYRGQALLLESLRRDIDDLQGAAGSLGDFIDRGNPGPVEEREAFESMERYRRKADEKRLRLKNLVERLRVDCPEILGAWSGAHLRVCDYFLDSLPDKSDDDKTARYVARTTRKAWKRLPHGDETFIGIPSNWLEGYLEKLDWEMRRCGAGRSPGREAPPHDS